MTQHDRSREKEHPEPLSKRYMQGMKCDMWSGPCSCGAWHHPHDTWESLEIAIINGWADEPPCEKMEIAKVIGDPKVVGDPNGQE